MTGPMMAWRRIPNNGQILRIKTTNTLKNNQRRENPSHPCSGNSNTLRPAHFPLPYSPLPTTLTKCTPQALTTVHRTPILPPPTIFLLMRRHGGSHCT
eukprot:5490217-Heterocapsa_arctica.AAC.1